MVFDSHCSIIYSSEKFFLLTNFINNIIIIISHIDFQIQTFFFLQFKTPVLIVVCVVNLQEFSQDCTD
nr:MAG TPA: hypothetical protein [Caudoviricetes sp.]